MGSTIALTASMLRKIGGFQAFRDHLADDYEIGRAVLGVDSRIEAVTVSTTKLRPPIGADVATVGVRRRCVR